MAFDFRPVVRDQQFLLAQDVRDWVPKDHVVHFVIDLVERLDLSAFREAYRLGYQGRRAYEPGMLLTLLLYAALQGVRSSRCIERACRTDAAYKLICGTYGDSPDHVTICRFRQRHEGAIKGVFCQVLLACWRAGLLRLAVIGVDGTKFEADAAMDVNRTVATLRDESVRILAEMESVDAEETARFGAGCGDEMPAEFVDAARRLERIEEALAYAEAELAHAGEDARVNVTDPESRLMRGGRGGYLQGYNGQVAACESDVIVGARVTNQENDYGLLGPMVREVAENLDAAGIEDRPETVVADAGYFDSDDIADIESDPAGPEPLVATRKRKDQPTKAPEGDPEADHAAETEAVATAQAAEAARRVAAFERIQTGEINQAQAAAELGLDRSSISVSYRAWLTEGPEAIRPKRLPRKHRKPSASQLTRRIMETKLADLTNRVLYNQRGHIAETPFAAIKHIRNGGRFRRRGLAATNAELLFEATVHNIARLHTALGVLDLFFTGNWLTAGWATGSGRT